MQGSSSSYHWRTTTPPPPQRKVANSPFGSPSSSYNARPKVLKYDSSNDDRADSPLPRTVSPLSFNFSYDQLETRLAKSTFKPKATKTAASKTNIILQLAAILACLGAGLAGGVWFVHTTIVVHLEEQYQEAFESAKDVQRKMREKILAMETKKSDTMRRERYLNATLLDLERQQDELIHALKDLADGSSQLHKSIQMESKRNLLEKYGPGPHRLEMQLAFDPASNVYSENDGPSKIIIEMAPADLMPHTVFFFLEQVSKGLWDGTSFHRNARHLLQTGPVNNFLAPRSAPSPLIKFKAAKLKNLLFPEYSPEFPHAKYTLGFVGRPGGPDFYINTLDNEEIHGPAIAREGEDNLFKQLDPDSGADPCFAKVIEGFDTIQRLQRADVVTGGFRRLKHYVAIQQIRVLPH